MWSIRWAGRGGKGGRNGVGLAGERRGGWQEGQDTGGQKGADAVLYNIQAVLGEEIQVDGEEGEPPGGAWRSRTATATARRAAWRDPRGRQQGSVGWARGADGAAGALSTLQC